MQEWMINTYFAVNRGGKKLCAQEHLDIMKISIIFKKVETYLLFLCSKTWQQFIVNPHTECKGDIP